LTIVDPWPHRATSESTGALRLRGQHSRSTKINSRWRTLREGSTDWASANLGSIHFGTAVARGPRQRQTWVEGTGSTGSNLDRFLSRLPAGLLAVPLPSSGSNRRAFVRNTARAPHVSHLRGAHQKIETRSVRFEVAPRPVSTEQSKPEASARDTTRQRFSAWCQAHRGRKRNVKRRIAV